MAQPVIYIAFSSLQSALGWGKGAAAGGRGSALLVVDLLCSFLSADLLCVE